jgi:hypothetical protein
VPVLIETPFRLTAIASSGTSAHTCGITADAARQAVCWGYNPFGQAGPAEDHIWLPIVADSRGPFATLGTGNSHTCGLTARGVVCWGSYFR